MRSIWFRLWVPVTIEYDRFNAPVGYWIRQYTLDGMTTTEPVYLKASDVIFYFSKRRPSQLREMSDMSQTVTRIRDANEFMTAVSMNRPSRASQSLCSGVRCRCWPEGPGHWMSWTPPRQHQSTRGTG